VKINWEWEKDVKVVITLEADDIQRILKETERKVEPKCKLSQSEIDEAVYYYTH